MSETCWKCGSVKIIPLVGVMDQGQHSDGHLKAHIAYTNPEAWLFKGPVYAYLQATISGECGYTELTAANPAALYDAYLVAKSRAEHDRPAQLHRIAGGANGSTETGWGAGV